MYQIYMDGKPKFEPRATALRCVADILERGWFEPVERFGIVWIKGIENQGDAKCRGNKYQQS